MLHDGSACRVHSSLYGTEGLGAACVAFVVPKLNFEPHGCLGIALKFLLPSSDSIRWDAILRPPWSHVDKVCEQFTPLALALRHPLASFVVAPKAAKRFPCGDSRHCQVDASRKASFRVITIVELVGWLKVLLEVA